MTLNPKVYDIMKYAALVGLPALATFWAVFGAVWNIDHTDQVVKTIVAVSTLLGALTVINKVTYDNSDAAYDGVIDPVTANSQTSPTALELHDDEYDAANQKVLRLRVKQHDPIV